MTDAERERILEGLRENRRKFDAARDAYNAATAERRDDLWQLLEEGIAAGIGRKAMSRAAGLSLPSLTEVIESRPRRSRS